MRLAAAPPGRLEQPQDSGLLQLLDRLGRHLALRLCLGHPAPQRREEVPDRGEGLVVSNLAHRHALRPSLGQTLEHVLARVDAVTGHTGTLPAYGGRNVE
jgi:hypothetical protein